MLREREERLPARVRVDAQGTYYRTGVERYRRWLDAIFGLRFALFKDGEVPGTRSPVAMRSDAPPEHRNSPREKFG
jgi:hypothetical protein